MYRCCRVEMYPSGTQPEAMEGHYIEADSLAEAKKTMGKRFKGETRFFAELHKVAGARGKG